MTRSESALAVVQEELRRHAESLDKSDDVASLTVTVRFDVDRPGVRSVTYQEERLTRKRALGMSFGSAHVGARVR